MYIYIYTCCIHVYISPVLSTFGKQMGLSDRAPPKSIKIPQFSIIPMIWPDMAINGGVKSSIFNKPMYNSDDG